MFGNLSKNLIKVPNHFNIHLETEPRLFSKKSYENLINTNNNLKIINLYNSNKNPHYFKEKDFLKKNLQLDLNYNNNFRKNLTPSIKPRLSMSFEEFIFGKRNNNNDIYYNNGNKLIKYNTRFNTETGTKYSSNSKKEFFSSKHSLHSRESDNIKANMTKLDNEEFNGNLNTNIDKLITKIYGNSLNFNLFKKKKGFGGTTRQKRIEILKEFINKDQVVIPPQKLKFPKIKIKSNENVYRDTMDKKLTSLSMLSPKVKEQLKTKNRYFTAQKEFYKYNNSYYSNQKNPLTETVKCLEEKENKEK